MGMSPSEALYERRCGTPVTWDNPVNRIVLGLELLKEMEQEVVKIRQTPERITGQTKKLCR